VDRCMLLGCWFFYFFLFFFPLWAVLSAWAVGWVMARLVRRIWGLFFSLPFLRVGVVCLMSDYERVEGGGRK